KTQTELQKIEKQILSERQKLITSRTKEAQQLAKLKVQNADRNKQAKLEAELSKKNIGTLQRLTLANRKLTEERKKLNLETAKGRKRLIEINKALDNNNNKLKDSSDQLGKQKINIGNYQSALSGLPGPLGGAARATQALTKASLAFILTPIGAVIAAIGIALGILTTFFKGSEEGQNSFNKITKAALVIWGNFKDIIIDVGKGIFKLISLDFKGAKEAFSDAADGVKNFVKESKAELKIQNELSDLRAKNIVLLRESRIFEAKSLTKIAELREGAAKIEETNAAKAAGFIRKAIQLNEEIAAKKEEILQNDLRIASEEAELSESTTETLNEIVDAEIALEDARRDRAIANVRRLKELNTLEIKAATQAKEAAKQDISIQRELFDIQSKRLDLVKNSFVEQVNAKQDQIDRTLSLEQKLTEGLEIQNQKRIEDYKAGQDELRKIDKKSQEERREIIDASIQLSKEIFSGFTTLRIQQIGQELTAIEFARNRELEQAGKNERAKFEINKRFDEERRKLQREQVITERANALFNIAIFTATNIAKVSANPFLIALVAAIGAVQAALVIAAPMPKFDEGKEHTPTDYIAGEKRPELRKSKGKWSIVNEPTMFKNSPGDQIISGKETDSILGGISDLTGKNLLTDPGLLLSLLNNNMEKRNDIDLAYVIKKGNEDVVRSINKKKFVGVYVNTSRRTKVTEEYNHTTVKRVDVSYKYD
ncbi:MAG: hypothetical protein IID16_00700, partial [Candidatus Marinimicrobia bacterium]|nr:hypothetical protein [Candidatus Neomarinimicrobiota bacterium]